MRYELSDYERTAIKPMLPNKPRGVPRVDDCRVLNGGFWVLRSGAPWRDLPENYGPYTTCYNHFVRVGKAGIWDQIFHRSAIEGSQFAFVPHLYRARNFVERFFNKVKQCRRIAAHYENSQPTPRFHQAGGYTHLATRL